MKQFAGNYFSADWTAGVRNFGSNCWNKKVTNNGQKCTDGSCPWCGTGSCCRKGRSGGSGDGRCNGRIGGNGYHACVMKPSAYAKFSSCRTGLLHNQANCWNRCGKIQGPCTWCGTGSCCKKGHTDKSRGCDGSFGGNGYHACALPTASFPLQTDGSPKDVNWNGFRYSNSGRNTGPWMGCITEAKMIALYNMLYAQLKNCVIGNQGEQDTQLVEQRAQFQNSSTSAEQLLTKAKPRVDDLLALMDMSLTDRSADKLETKTGGWACR